MDVLGGLILALVIAGCGAAVVTSVMRSVTARLPEPPRLAGRRFADQGRKAVKKGRRAAEPLRNVIVRPMAEARAADWLDRRRTRRDAKALRPAREPVLRRIVTPRGGAAVAPADPAPAVARQPDPRANGRHLQPVPPPAANVSGRTPPVTTGTTASGAGIGAGADMMNSVQHLITHILHGGIEAKQRGFSVSSESFSYMADQFLALSRQMAEPGQNYPPSAYEPWAVVATHLHAAAMAAGEGGSVIQSIRNMTVGELAVSSVRAPHHDELNKA